MTEEKKFLSRVGAAAYLDVHPATFDNFRKRFPEDLEAFMLGGTMPRWKPEQLDAFVEKHRGGWASRGGKRVA